MERELAEAQPEGSTWKRTVSGLGGQKRHRLGELWSKPGRRPRPRGAAQGPPWQGGALRFVQEGNAPSRLADTAEFSGNGMRRKSLRKSPLLPKCTVDRNFLLTGTFFPTARSSRRSKICVRASRPFPLFAGRLCLSPYAGRRRVSQSLSKQNTRYCDLQGFYGPGRSRTSARRFEV
jgi:hypothetical protein